MPPGTSALAALFGLEEPWSAAYFRDPQGTLALLALRCGILATMAMETARSTTPPSTRERLVLAAAGALVLASLVWRGLTLPVVVLTAVLIVTRRTWSARAKGAAASASVLLIALAAAGSRPVDSVGAARSLGQATKLALDRGNLYEARFWSARWSESEGDAPRDGTLIRALVENQAGHPDLARRIAADVVSRSHDESVRARARSALLTFGGGT